jgi:hypothetical protein
MARNVRGPRAHSLCLITARGIGVFALLLSLWSMRNATIRFASQRVRFTPTGDTAPPPSALGRENILTKRCATDLS